MGEPVDEEDDVPGLFLHDVIEDVEQRVGNEGVLARELEETEGAEGVEAFLETEVDERLHGVGRDLDLHLAGVELVEPDQVSDDSRVARLLRRLELERLTDERVTLERGARGDHRTGILLRLQGEGPERQAAQQREGLAIDRRPGELRRLVASMPLE